MRFSNCLRSTGAERGARTRPGGAPFPGTRFLLAAGPFGAAGFLGAGFFGAGVFFASLGLAMAGIVPEPCTVGSQMSPSDWTLAGVGVYMLLTLVVGIWAGSGVESGEDFMVAGRTMPRWLCTFTLFATWFGGGTCLGAAGKVYQHGLAGAIVDPLGAALCLLLSAAFFFRAMRRFRFVTVSDFFRARFGPRTEFLASLCMVPAYVGWIASQIVAFAFVIKAITSLSQEVAIVTGAVIVLVYTALGGMWAVAVTDFFQALVLIFGLVMLLPAAWDAAGGWEKIVVRLPAAHKAFLPAGNFKAWLWFLHSWVVIGLGDLPSQGLMSRAMSAEDDGAASQSGYAAAFLYVTVGLVPVTLGMLGVILVPQIGDPEHILLEVAQMLLSPLLMAVFAGALISALMSSADSALLAVASIMVENLIRPMKGELSPRQSLSYCRWCVLLAAILATVLALKFQKVFVLMVAASATGLAALMAPFVAGLYWKRANGPGAVASIVAGIAAWIVFEVAGAGAPPESWYPTDLMAAGVSILALVVVSLATAESSPPMVVEEPAPGP